MIEEIHLKSAHLSGEAVGNRLVRIETRRLLIQPLTHEQLTLYLANNGSLEKQMGLICSPKEQDDGLADALQDFFLPQVQKHPDHFYFYTLWAIILKEQRALVGDLCFKGPPDEEGNVEIGYATYPLYRQQGIMTEAVGGFLTWCTAQPTILALMAETETGNEASEKILAHHNFHRDCQTLDNSWWSRKVSE